ncbi:MAG: permease [Pseudomonadota bacterium]
MTDLVIRGLDEARNRLSQVSNVWLLILLIPLGVWAFDPAQAVPVIEKAIASFLHTLPFIVFAVLLASYLKAAGAETLIARVFEGRQTRMIFLAALIGGLAPFCSCEVIPFVAGLLAVGVPLSAIMAFWLSSPLMDPAQLLITASALGWEFALAKAAGAVAIGLLGGFAVRAFASAPVFADPARPREAGGSCCKKQPFSGAPVWRFWSEAERREAFQSEAILNMVFLTKWLMLAYLLEALLVTYIPAEFIARYVGGDGVVPVVTAAVVALPAYLNGYAAVPLVDGLMQQGMSPGAAMAFLMAGAVSCIPAMAGVYSLVKFRVFAAYVLLGLGGSMLIGLAYSAIA